MLEGKYRVKGNNDKLKDGDIVEFVEGFSVCSGLCSACETLKKIKKMEDVEENLKDIKLEKIED